MDQAQSTPTTRDGWLAPLAVLIAMLVGGGGARAPFSELMLQLTLALFFTAWLWQRASGGRNIAVPSTAWLLAATCLALPILQLIPLPAPLWQALPGRELEREALALIDADNTWRPISFDPTRTLASLLAMAGAVAVLLISASSSRAGRNRIAPTMALVALLTMLLGAGQLAGSYDGPLRFYVPLSTFLEGFQANHNSTADVLLIGMVAATLSLRQWIEHGQLPERRGLILGIAAGVTALLLLGVVLTASRTGMMLVPIALSAQAAILWPWLRGNRRAIAMTLAGGLIVALVLAFLLQGNAVLLHVVNRFNFTGELRPELWRDSLVAARQTFPFGSGMGTFVPTFMTYERLEVVRDTISNRAHNELLELAIEGGAFALGLLVLGGGIVAFALVRVLRSSRGLDRARAQFAGAAITILSTHSLVDYPFRSMSLACAAAACAGLVLALAADCGQSAGKAVLKEEA